MKHPLIAAITLVASLLALEDTGPRKNTCETYHGYKSDSDGKVRYVFDLKTIEGNAALRNSLAIGQRYCVSYMEPILPVGLKRLKILPAEQSDLESRAENIDLTKTR